MQPPCAAIHSRIDQLAAIHAGTAPAGGEHSPQALTLQQCKQLARRAFEEHVPFLTIAHCSEMLEEVCGRCAVGVR